MDMKQAVTQVLIAALSVIGFYGILCAVFETALRPKQITPAVVVRSMKDAEDLDILLCEARRAPCKGARRRLFLIVSADLMEGLVGEAGQLKEEYAILAERYGAEVAVWPSTETKQKTE